MLKIDSATLLIVGTGALANLFAARLLHVGIRVAMLGTWPEGLTALRENGVTLVDGEFSQRFPVEIASPEVDVRKYQLALVLVKSWQTDRAAHQLKNILAPDGVALTLQNGLGNKEILVNLLGDERVSLGVTTTGATLVAPGKVRPGGEGKISLEDHPSSIEFSALLAKAGFDVEIAADVDALIWSKLVINAAINPLTALLHVANGALLNLPSARVLMSDLARETAQVAKALDITLLFSDPAAVAEDVAHRTARNHSSMFQDISRGAPTEIDAICGAIVRAGEQVGVSAPVNDTMWKLVKAAVNKQSFNQQKN